jgi:hypothetical protein
VTDDVVVERVGVLNKICKSILVDMFQADLAFPPLVEEAVVDKLSEQRGMAGE